MAFERRSFAGGGANTTLASGIDGSTDTISITDATGWPSGSGGDFFVVIDLGQSTEEKVRVASRAGTTLTVATSGRGADGTSGVAHDSGATIALCLAAVDLDEANEHVSDSRTTAHAAGKISYDNGDSGLSATTVQDAVDEVVSSGSSGLLACTQSLAGQINVSSTSFTDTGISVTFDVPASGSVLARLTGLVQLQFSSAGNSGGNWALRNGSSLVNSNTEAFVIQQDPAGSATIRHPATAEFLVTSLTPGATLTWKWSHRVQGASAGTMTLRAGSAGGTATDVEAPAVMSVWAVPA